MKSTKNAFSILFATIFMFSWTVANAGGQDYSGNEDPNKKILKQGLLGAGVGAISAEASGGKAGTGALVGAGTNVIGGALLDTLTSGPSQPRPQAQQVQYVQAAPSYPVQTQGYQQSYQQAEPVYVQQQPVYYQQPPQQEDPNKRILKQGLLGAGVGAISASASGGKAGKGALIGAGTNVIGGALLDTLMGGGSSQQQQAPQPVYYQQAPQQQYQPQYNSNQQQSSNRCKQVTYYDGEGNPVKTVEEC